MRELLTRTDKVFCESIGNWEHESRNHKVVSLSRVVEIMSSAADAIEFVRENEITKGVDMDARFPDELPRFEAWTRSGSYVEWEAHPKGDSIILDSIRTQAGEGSSHGATGEGTRIIHTLFTRYPKAKSIYGYAYTPESTAFFKHIGAGKGLNEEGDFILTRENFYRYLDKKVSSTTEATVIDPAPHVDSLTANQDTEKLLQLIHIHRGRPIGVQGLGGVKVGDEVIVKGDYQVDYPSWNGIAIAGTELGTVLVYDPDTEQVYELSARELDY